MIDTLLPANFNFWLLSCIGTLTEFTRTLLSLASNKESTDQMSTKKKKRKEILTKLPSTTCMSFLCLEIPPDTQDSKKLLSDAARDPGH